MKYIVDIHGEIEGDYDIIKKYDDPKTQKWIPVSERLPEDGETVLVQFDDGNMDILTFPNIYKRLNRVAWMPLPPAYKEEEE